VDRLETSKEGRILRYKPDTQTRAEQSKIMSSNAATCTLLISWRVYAQSCRLCFYGEDEYSADCVLRKGVGMTNAYQKSKIKCKQRVVSNL
jgi:hypothetical protein